MDVDNGIMVHWILSFSLFLSFSVIRIIFNKLYSKQKRNRAREMKKKEERKISQKTFSRKDFFQSFWLLRIRMRSFTSFLFCLSFVFLLSKRMLLFFPEKSLNFLFVILSKQFLLLSPFYFCFAFFFVRNGW